MISTGNQPRSSSSASSPVAADNMNKANIIKSPMVGTAYLAPEPGAKPFVTVGAILKKAKQLLLSRL